jgi:suppressor for copper-sensitivity B
MNDQFVARRWLLGLCLALWTSVLWAEPPSTGWLKAEEHPSVQVRLAFTGEPLIDGRVNALLQVRLEKDWKTYWRSPGEGGVAPSVDWSTSHNLSDVHWHWPLPERFNLLGLDILGYQNEVGFPLQFKLADTGQPLQLRGTLTLPSCTTICLLTDYDIELRVDPGQLRPSDSVLHRYNQFLSRVPRESNRVQIERLQWDGERLQVIATKAGGWRSPDVMVDTDAEQLEDVFFNKPQLATQGDQLTATFTPDYWLDAPEIDGQRLRITLADDDLAAEHEVLAAAASGPLTPDGSGGGATSLLAIVGVALLGGLILNVMPCVLPVLGIKLHSLASAGGLERRRIRSQFLASATGILVSFWLLALFLLILQWTGRAVGWGIQFQSPVFIALMLLVTWLFALNLLGLYEFRLPGSMNQWLATQGDHSRRGHFVQGMFATLLATPCSAPFLGTAVAFALGASALELWFTFSALALGMAAPWLLVASAPGLARWLPKPGRWMNVMRGVFGVLMALTSLWLLSLLANFLSGSALSALLLALVAVSLWFVYRRLGRKAFVVSLTAGIPGILGLMLLGSLTLGYWGHPLPPDHRWHTFEQSAIDERVQAGETVFVDVTADWCITCRANKIGVLLQQPVYDTLGEEGVHLLKADWTQPDERITDYLRSHGQFGVPFNIVYGPGAPEGIALPVILRERDVMDAVRRARGDG